MSITNAAVTRYDLERRSCGRQQSDQLDLSYVNCIYSFLQQLWTSTEASQAQPRSIIKLVCSYPITDFLWILDFILYNWQELTGKDSSNDSKVEIAQHVSHRRAAPSGDKGTAGRCAARLEPVTPCGPPSISRLPAVALESNSSERNGLQYVPNKRKIDIDSAYIIADRLPSNLISKSFIWLNDSAWKF